MYELRTEIRQAVQPENAVDTGRILVIDDDRTFGGFMLAALETRGHTVDWAGCIADGVASLWSSRYDLVIVDLRLPDGSGLDFLREATDGGLLTGSSAIILTGHEFDAPDDIRVFSKSMALEPFLDRMSDIVAGTRRRRESSSSGARHSGQYGGASHDGAPKGKVHKIELVLYVSAASEKCQKAVRTVRDVLEKYDAAQVKFNICDMSGRPQDGDTDGVVFTPTLVKRAPGPRTWIVGNIDQPELLADLLDMSGVERRRDGR